MSLDTFLHELSSAFLGQRQNQTCTPADQLLNCHTRAVLPCSNMSPVVEDGVFDISFRSEQTEVS